MSKKKRVILILFFIALAICVCVSIYVASRSRSSKMGDRLELGEKYLEELEYEKALVVYKEILMIDAKFVKAYLGMAEVYMAMGEYEEALNALEEGYGKNESRELEKKIEEVEVLIACEESYETKEPEAGNNIYTDGNDEQSIGIEETELEKMQVIVDLNGLAAAYSQFMYSECMHSSTAFGLFDITGDGIPELFSERGSDVITYWGGQCWEMVCNTSILEWYYNEITKEPGMYYYSYYEWDGTVEEWIRFFSIDVTHGENPREWMCRGEQITQNIDKNTYTYINTHAYDKTANSDMATMLETLKNWFACQEKYEYVMDETPSDLEIINNVLNQYDGGEVFDYVVIEYLSNGIEAFALTKEIYSAEELEYGDIIQVNEDWGDEISRIAGWYINGSEAKRIFLSSDDGYIPTWLSEWEIGVQLCPPLMNGTQLIEVGWSVSGYNNGAIYYEISDNDVLYAFLGMGMMTITQEGRILECHYVNNPLSNELEGWYTEYEYENGELKLINEWVENY